MSYDFQIFCSISIPQDDTEFCFYLSPVFGLLPIKICTMKKIKTFKEKEILCEI